MDAARRILYRTTALRVVAVSPTLRLDVVVAATETAGTTGDDDQSGEQQQQHSRVAADTTLFFRLAGIAVPLGSAAAAAAREALAALLQGRVLQVHVAAFDSPTATFLGTLPEVEHRAICDLVRRGLLPVDRRTLLLSHGSASLNAAGRDAQAQQCGVWDSDCAHAAFSNPLLAGPFEATVLSVPSGAALLVHASRAAPTCCGDDTGGSVHSREVVEVAASVATTGATILVRVAFASDPIDAILDTPASFGAIDIPQAAFSGRSFLRHSLLGQRVTVHPITLSACGTYLIGEVSAPDAAFDAPGCGDVAERLFLEGCASVAHPQPVHLPFRSFVVPPPARVLAAASLAPLRPPAPPVTVYRPPRDADALRTLLPTLAFFRPQRATVEAVADDWSAVALLLHDGMVLVPARLAGVATTGTSAAAAAAHAMRERRALVIIIALDEEAALFECVITSIEDAPGLLADFTAFANTEAACADAVAVAASASDADAHERLEHLQGQLKEQLHDVMERATASSINAAALADGWGSPYGCGRIVHPVFPESRCVARALTDAYAPPLRCSTRSIGVEDNAAVVPPATANVTVVGVADDATVTVQVDDPDLRDALATLERAPLSSVAHSLQPSSSSDDGASAEGGFARTVATDEWLLLRGPDGALQRIQVAAVSPDAVVARPVDIAGDCITVSDPSALLRPQIARGTDCRTLPAGLGAAMETIRQAPPLLQDVALAFVRVNPGAAATAAAALGPARLVARVLQTGERLRMRTLYSRQRLQSGINKMNSSSSLGNPRVSDGASTSMPCLLSATATASSAGAVATTSFSHDGVGAAAGPRPEASMVTEIAPSTCCAAQTYEQCVLFSAVSPSRGSSSSGDDGEDAEPGLDMESIHHLLLRESRDVVSIDFDALDRYSDHIWRLADGVAAYD
jgi:hypothetical protein